jgi:hypothetical protein
VVAVVVMVMMKSNWFTQRVCHPAAWIYLVRVEKKEVVHDAMPPRRPVPWAPIPATHEDDV